LDSDKDDKTVNTSLIVTCVYPSNQTEDQLIPLRKLIHQALDLPDKRPLIRRNDAFQFNKIDTANDECEKYLKNPHTSVKSLENSKKKNNF
jgi:hypothetical protein